MSTALNGWQLSSASKQVSISTKTQNRRWVLIRWSKLWVQNKQTISEKTSPEFTICLQKELNSKTVKHLFISSKVTRLQYISRRLHCWCRLQSILGIALLFPTMLRFPEVFPDPFQASAILSRTSDLLFNQK